MLKRLMSILMVTTCGMAMLQAQGVEDFVAGMMERYPEARLLDIYKSCFQDYMGAEHLVGDKESARAYLEQEMTTDDELLPWYYEPCGTEGRYVRVSLLAVRDGKISADELLDAFVRSANDPDRPTVEQWARRWHEFLGIIETMKLDLPHYDEDKAFIEQVLSMGKYAISHSPEYRRAYSPHYRIVKHEIFEQELLPLITRDILPCRD